MTDTESEYTLPGVIENVDYVVVRGTLYQVQVDDYRGETHLVERDEIPQGYWERWDDV